MPRSRRLFGFARSRPSRPNLWPLLVVAGLLSVPAECARIGHPHSLFQTPSVGAASDPSTPSLHSASEHSNPASQDVPAWAMPLGEMATAVEHVHTAASQSEASVLPGPGSFTSRLQSGIVSANLPVIEPLAQSVIAAFGTPVALLLVLVVALSTGGERNAITVQRLIGSLGRALDPPPPRSVIFGR